MEGIRPIPPNDFCKKLYQFDPDLRITWADDMECWQIWHADTDKNQLSHVMNVVENDGTYRALDDRVFLILTKNKWYADHPEQLEADVVDSYIEQKKNEAKSKEDDIKHLGKDRVLKREFERVRELASTVDDTEWKTTRSLLGPDGKPVRDEDGTELKYIPHESLNEL